MIVLLIFAVLCAWRIYAAIKEDKRAPKLPAPPPVVKSPRRLQMEAAIRKIAGSDVVEEKLDALCLEAPHVLVTARAGSGKTATIAIRTALAVHQGARPEHILSLCFNRSASKELGARLDRYSAGDVPASTFHALAFAIVRPLPCNIIFGERQRALMRHLIGKSEKQEKDEEDETENVLGFISSCKHRGLGVEDVQKKCESVGGLAPQAARLYAAYAKHLKNHGLLDFDDLIELATAKLSALNRAPVVRLNGRTCNLNALRILAIDEFQDFSRSFYGLVKTLMDRNSSMSTYCVGDDWQGINAFAGSNACYFNRFENYFSGAKRAQLQINYRSYRAIVDYSNKWMKGCGEGGLAIKEGGVVEHVKTSGGVGELSVHQGLKKLVARERGRSVLVLARRNVSHGVDLEAYQKDLSRLHPNVRVSTIHGAKGSEADTVFFLKEPKTISRLSCINGMLGQTEEEIQAEERRIEYVALTRTRERLLIVQ